MTNIWKFLRKERKKWRRSGRRRRWFTQGQKAAHQEFLKKKVVVAWLRGARGGG